MATTALIPCIINTPVVPQLCTKHLRLLLHCWIAIACWVKVGTPPCTPAVSTFSQPPCKPAAPSFSQPSIHLALSDQHKHTQKDPKPQYRSSSWRDGSAPPGPPLPPVVMPGVWMPPPHLASHRPHHQPLYTPAWRRHSHTTPTHPPHDTRHNLPAVVA